MYPSVTSGIAAAARPPGPRSSPRHGWVIGICFWGPARRSGDRNGEVMVIGICFWGPRDDRAAGQLGTPTNPDALPRGRPSRPGEAAPPEYGEYPAHRTRLSRASSRGDQGLVVSRIEGVPGKRGSRPRRGYRAMASGLRGNATRCRGYGNGDPGNGGTARIPNRNRGLQRVSAWPMGC